MKNFSLGGCLDRYSSKHRDTHSPEMAELIRTCSDLLDREDLHFSLSHHFLWISTFAEYEEARRHPELLVTSDGQHFDLAYKEHWRDGAFHRGREETIRCEMGAARVALQELINRLLSVRR
jgi:hypothetical protein